MQPPRFSSRVTVRTAMSLFTPRSETPVSEPVSSGVVPPKVTTSTESRINTIQRHSGLTSLLFLQQSIPQPTPEQIKMIMAANPGKTEKQVCKWFIKKEQHRLRSLQPIPGYEIIMSDDSDETPSDESQGQLISRRARRAEEKKAEESRLKEKE